jgi:hypothetical protein
MDTSAEFIEMGDIRLKEIELMLFEENLDCMCKAPNPKLQVEHRVWQPMEGIRLLCIRQPYDYIYNCKKKFFAGIASAEPR